jgi:CO/xanthine dehydrogenase Mo-binding subunit
MSDAHIEQTNFDSYTPVSMKAVPEIDVSIISNGEPAVGCGEPAVTVIAPAVGNAVFNATGIRIRDLPITLDKLIT